METIFQNGYAAGCWRVMRSFAYRPKVRSFPGRQSRRCKEKDMANEMTVNVLTSNEGHQLYPLYTYYIQCQVNFICR